MEVLARLGRRFDGRFDRGEGLGCQGGRGGRPGWGQGVLEGGGFVVVCLLVVGGEEGGKGGAFDG